MGLFHPKLPIEFRPFMDNCKKKPTRNFPTTQKKQTQQPKPSPFHPFHPAFTPPNPTSARQSTETIRGGLRQQIWGSNNSGTGGGLLLRLTVSDLTENPRGFCWFQREPETWKVFDKSQFEVFRIKRCSTPGLPKICYGMTYCVLLSALERWEKMGT